MQTTAGPPAVTLVANTMLLTSPTPMMGNVPTNAMDGPMSSVRCPPDLPQPPVSTPSAADHPARSTPTTPNVPIFPQDARDVTMSAPREMETRTSWTTGSTVQEGTHPEASQHLQDSSRGPHPPKSVTTSVTQMEAALPPMLDHQDLVNMLEAVFLTTLVGAVLEHLMNARIVTKYFLVLQKKSKSQCLIQEHQETKPPGIVITNATHLEPRATEAVPCATLDPTDLVKPLEAASQTHSEAAALELPVNARIAIKQSFVNLTDL